MRKARLHFKGGDKVPRREADPVPEKELVKPDVVQRPQDGREAPHPGLRREGVGNGLTPVQVGGGRRRNPT